MKITAFTIKRAVRTFIQTVLGYFAVNLAFVDFTDDKAIIKQALIGLCVSAASAGLSAIMNLEEVSGDDI